MKTYFVLGAGANVDIGMPTGDILLKTISWLFHFENNSLIRFSGTMDNFKNAINKLKELKNISNITAIGEKIKTGLPLELSIDNFLYKHYDDKELVACGKLAIAFAILGYERSCKMYTETDEFPISSIQNSWYIQLFQRITEGCRIKDLLKRLENIVFIIFNYDRCFERFLCNALMNNYSIDYQNALEIVEEIKIIHPYGSLGDCKFGEIISEERLIDITNRIKLYTENENNLPDNYLLMPSMINTSYRVIFFGFAYHIQNMNIIFNQSVINRNSKSLFGTGLGISKNDSEYLTRNWISRLGIATNFTILNNDCKDFLKEFQYTLTFTD